MVSGWYDKTEQAIELRKAGKSLREIEKRLKIPRSTLSGWLRNIELTESQRMILLKRWRAGLTKAREKAAQWHRSEKEKRLLQAKIEASKVLNNLNLRNKNILDLALAMLYLGEGYKKNDETGIGNSDPLLLKFFLSILRINYNIDIEKIRCELYLRADQDFKKMKRFWSRQLELPLKNFKYVSIDKRTKGKKTFSDYKGVCAVRCANVAIQRKLLTISKEFCTRVINLRP